MNVQLVIREGSESMMLLFQDALGVFLSAVEKTESTSGVLEAVEFSERGAGSVAIGAGGACSMKQLLTKFKCLTPQSSGLRLKSTIFTHPKLFSIVQDHIFKL